MDMQGQAMEQLASPGWEFCLKRIQGREAFRGAGKHGMLWCRRAGDRLVGRGAVLSHGAVQGGIRAIGPASDPDRCEGVGGHLAWELHENMPPVCGVLGHAPRGPPRVVQLE